MIVTNAYNEREKFITICFVYDEIALREFIKSPLLSPSKTVSPQSIGMLVYVLGKPKHLPRDYWIWIEDDGAERQFAEASVERNVKGTVIRVQHQGQEYVTQFDLAEVLMW